MSVHKDYYENYGVEFQRAESLWIGVVHEGMAELLEVPLKGVRKRIETHERLKDSYYVVQEEWKEEAVHEISD